MRRIILHATILTRFAVGAILGQFLDLSGKNALTASEPAMIILAELIAPFLDDNYRRLRPNTRRAYRADLVIAAAHFTGPLEQITHKQDITLWEWPGQPPLRGRRGFDA